ncbi:pilin glycosylation ligase domain-containing protein [Acinetobacter sp. CIP 102136]|uniref:pilin glycosylation ligase domain-containing protein n=1 Tax=Acinetobacter sp. CIP 102136 TaxID=1144665 RepID=UPI0003A50750|nr:pilin glycosylation ligase domain-containing protein [Acinetobacter sp. CIP 102136]
MSWLSVNHYNPWVVFYNEYYAVIALIISMFFFINKSLKIPKIIIPIIFLSFVPVIHFFIGKVFYFSIGFMGFIYVSCFWLAIILGFNLCNSIFDRVKIFYYFSCLLVFVGFVTGCIAIFQWLNLEDYIPWIRDINGKQRPYGNFAQPNNMSTFLIMSLMACLYIYEIKKTNIRLIIISAIIILIGITLSQSRTAWLVSVFIFIYLSIYQYKDIVTLKWHYSIVS